MESTQAMQTPPPVGQGKVRFGLLAGIVVLVVLFTVGTLPRLRNKEHLAAMAQETHDATPQVTTVTPTLMSAADLILPGNIQAIEETVVNARTSGYLRRRYVDIGSRVKAGQVLAEIEAPEVDQQVAQAQADTARSQASSEQAQADVARLQATVTQTRADTIRLQAGADQARAELARSEAKLAQSRAGAANSRAKLAQTQQALEERKADLSQTRARLDIAEKTWKRWQKLLAQGAVSSQEADEKESDYNALVASVSSAQAAIRSAQADVEAAQENVNASLADVTAAQADVNASRHSVSAAQAAVASNQAMVMAAQANVRASQSSVQAAHATIRSNEANYQRYAVLRSFDKVVAPFDGVITSRNVDTGALVKADNVSSGDNTGGTAPRNGLFGLARTDILRIQVNVPQTFMNVIRPGQPAQVLIREFPGRTFTGTVFQSAGALDANSRTLLTEIHLKNTDNLLRPGMYAQVQFHDPQAHQALHIAANTLLINAEGTRVATVTKEQKLHFVPVKIGRDFGTEVEIVEGLQGTETLVANPTDELQEGVAVRATAAPKPPDKK